MSRDTIHTIVLRSCGLDQIISCLKTTEFYHSKKELVGLMRCNKELYRLVLDRFLKLVEYPFTVVLKWNGNAKRRYHMDNLRHIYINDDYKKIPSLKLFPKLTHITFGRYFNEQILKGILPDQLTEIIFDHYFNHAIKKNVLPTNLKKLTFGNGFNCALKKGVLPDGLKILKFGRYTYCSDPIEDVLPKNLEQLFMRVVRNHISPDKIENIIKNRINGMRGEIIEYYHNHTSAYVCFTKIVNETG